MIVVGDGEATGRGVRVTQPDDLPTQAHTDWQHDTVPVCPARTSEDTSVGEIIVCNRKSCAVLVRDMGVEDHVQRRVAAAAVRCRTGSWSITPRASISLLDQIELPARRVRKCAFDGKSGKQQYVEAEERADLSGNSVNLRRHCLDLLRDLPTFLRPL